MRIVSTVISTLTALAFVGCAHQPGESLSWNGHTRLPKGKSVLSLNALANDSTRNRDERAQAIFTLFAHHIRPGFSAAQVHAVLTDTNWMSEVILNRLGGVGGMVPVELTFEDSVFTLFLFPVEENRQWSPWVIYLRLSGHGPDGLARSEEEARAFLCGDTTLDGNPKLLEFALCFPNKSETGRYRIERFSRRGVYVYE